MPNIISELKKHLTFGSVTWQSPFIIVRMDVFKLIHISFIFVLTCVLLYILSLYLPVMLKPYLPLIKEMVILFLPQIKNGFQFQAKHILEVLCGAFFLFFALAIAAKEYREFKRNLTCYFERSRNKPSSS